MAKGLLALLGSGETAPGMTKIHRSLLSRYETMKAVNIDTPYGFQQNVPEMTEKLIEYFNISLQTKLEPLGFESYERTSPVNREIFRQKLREANYVFSGPGSPTYALSQWKPMDLGNELFKIINAGGTVCFSSAAVLTLGAFTAPIYEIYKAGSSLYWLEGLDLLKLLGLNCVVIPHFDNAEGGNYDTSACYLGLKRLVDLEDMLPPGTATLGIDEHTAVLIDLEEKTLRVEGRSNAHWRLNGAVKTIHSGEVISILELQNISVDSIINEQETSEIVSVNEIQFLIEQISPQTSEAEKAVAALAFLAERGSEGKIEAENLVEMLLKIRSEARANGNYQLSDEIRNSLNSSKILISDSDKGTTWIIDED